MYITFSYISNDMLLHMTCFPCTFIEVSPVLLWTIEFQDISRFSTGFLLNSRHFHSLEKEMLNSRTFQEFKDAWEPCILDLVNLD